MHQVVYVSSAVGGFGPDELRALLVQSRAKNAQLGITGILLYQDGNILQVLEGERETVETLVERIEADPRHRGFIRLLDREIDERGFPDWSMAFRDLADPALRELPGYSAFLNTPLTAEELDGRPDRVGVLLRTFKKGMG